MGTVKPQYTVIEGQTVKLWCNVSGTKNSLESRTLTAWRKLPEGHYITDKFARFKMRIGRYLRIKKVELADKGTYVCIAENPYGKITREIRLVVQGMRREINYNISVDDKVLKGAFYGDFDRFWSNSDSTNFDKVPLLKYGINHVLSRRRNKR